MSSTTRSEPRTETGRRLLDALEPDSISINGAESQRDMLTRLVCAIEAEAGSPPPAPLDVERLAEAISEAMNKVPWPGERGSITFGGLTYNAAARAIAAEYARLTPKADR